MKSKLPCTFPLAIAALFLTGAIARADLFVVDLSGPNESPAHSSPGTGFSTINFDLSGHTFTINLSFTGLQGTTTNAHVHSATAVPGAGTTGVATQTPSFVGFPLGVTSGSFTNTYSTNLLSFYNPSFVSANGGTAASAEAESLSEHPHQQRPRRRNPWLPPTGGSAGIVAIILGLTADRCDAGLGGPAPAACVDAANRRVALEVQAHLRGRVRTR